MSSDSSELQIFKREKFNENEEIDENFKTIYTTEAYYQENQNTLKEDLNQKTEDLEENLDNKCFGIILEKQQSLQSSQIFVESEILDDSITENGGPIQQLQQLVRKQSKRQQQEQQGEDNDQQEQNIKILMKLGQGGMGEVYSVFDFITKKQYAIKRFDKWDYYEKEKNFILGMQDQCGNKFQKYSVALVKYIDEIKQLWYGIGLCNLKNLGKKKKELKIDWLESELEFIMNKLIDFVILMDQHNFYHGDIKPENIVLETVFVDGYEFFDILMIDFGIAVNNPQQFLGRTHYFFHSELRKYQTLKGKNFPFISSKKERVQIELYTVGRTVLYLIQNQFDQNNQFKLFQYEITFLRQHYSEKFVNKLFSLLNEDYDISNHQIQIKYNYIKDKKHLARIYRDELIEKEIQKLDCCELIKELIQCQQNNIYNIRVIKIISQIVKLLTIEQMLQQMNLECLIQVASVIRDQGQTKICLEMYQVILMRLEIIHGPDSLKICDALKQIAEILESLMSDFQQSMENQKRVEIIYQKHGLELEMINSIKNQAYLLYRLEKIQDSKETFQIVLAKFQSYFKESKKSIEIPLILMLARIEYLQDNSQNSIELLQKALIFSQEQFGKKHMQTLDVLQEISLFYFREENYDESQNIFKEVKQICSSIQDQEDNILLNKVNKLEAYYLFKNKEYKKSEEISVKTENQIHIMFQIVKGLTQYQIAKIYFKQKNYEEAFSLNEKAMILISQKQGNSSKNVCKILFFAAKIKIKQKDLLIAEEFMNQSLTFMENKENCRPRYLAKKFKTFAKLKIALQEFQEATLLLKKAQQFYKQSKKLRNKDQIQNQKINDLLNQLENK